MTSFLEELYSLPGEILVKERKKERKGVGEEKKKRAGMIEVTIVLRYQLDKLTKQPTVTWRV